MSARLALSERVEDRAGIRDKAEALLNVPYRRLRTKLRRCGGAAIFYQDTAIAQKVGVREGVEYALINVYSCEEDRTCPQIAEYAVKWRVPEAADPIFVDLDVLRLLLELIDNSGGPRILLEDACVA